MLILIAVIFIMGLDFSISYLLSFSQMKKSLEKKGVSLLIMNK